MRTNEDDVRAQLESIGLLLPPGPLELAKADGSSRRCKVAGGDKEKRGWYRLSEWVTRDDGVMLIGTYGIYQGMDSGTRKVELTRDCAACGTSIPFKTKTCPSCGSKQFKAREISAEERAAMAAKMESERKRAQEERQRTADRAALRAGSVWAKALRQPADDKPADYLTRKGVQSYGLRYTESGALVIPMMDARGRVHGLQFVLPSHHPRRKKTGRDKEYWPAGLSKQGHWFQIGSPMRAGVCLVAEGYATAATLHAATGLPVAVAFDAGNLKPVASALKKSYKTDRILVCADDDYLTDGNPGCKAADDAARAVGGAWIKPEFPADRGGQKLTDFNDLQHFPEGGLHLVRAQVEARLAAVGWLSAGGVAMPSGGGENGAMPSMLTVDEAVARFWGTYGMGGKVLFDEVERRLVHKDDVMNLLPERAWADIKRHPGWRVARDSEIGFDPTEQDRAIRCNLFGGWPTVPRRGKCTMLLDLLFYLCSNDPNARAVYDWILKWLAYPIQHRGAKMQSAIVVHGPQGTGKSRFFEAVAEIYGIYGRVLGQDALEDKFNADWAEKKLFIVGDEVMAKVEMYHVKNRLKGFITGGTIRVNPKNVAAHTEKNQMNIVFLSNERQPLALENDDRRHCVIFTPPKPDDGFFAEVNEEIEAGGVAALHDYLLNLDLGDFRPWTKPPMTDAKQDLIDLGMGSEERFLREWQRLELEGRDGETLPFCPCLGSHLYKVYEDWCRRQGEFRPRPSNHFLNFIGKQAGWTAGKPESTWVTLTDRTIKGRKMVVPGVQAMADAARHAPAGSPQQDLARDRFGTKAEWLTACFFAFEKAMEVGQ